jgi:hypothetical protein
VVSTETLGTVVQELLRDPRELARMGAAAHAVCVRERGAVRRTMVMLGRIFARARYRRESAPVTAARC